MNQQQIEKRRRKNVIRALICKEIDQEEASICLHSGVGAYSEPTTRYAGRYRFFENPRVRAEYEADHRNRILLGMIPHDTLLRPSTVVPERK